MRKDYCGKNEDFLASSSREASVAKNSNSKLEDNFKRFVEKFILP